jgi:hypothetical protein
MLNTWVADPDPDPEPADCLSGDEARLLIAGDDLARAGLPVDDAGLVALTGFRRMAVWSLRKRLKDRNLWPHEGPPPAGVPGPSFLPDEAEIRAACAVIRARRGAVGVRPMGTAGPGRGVRVYRDPRLDRGR